MKRTTLSAVQAQLKKPLSAVQLRRLQKLRDMPDSEIDLSDIPEITNWDGAVRGKFYRPVKKPVTIRLDADVLAWLRASGRGYQTRINQTLRREMRAELLKK